MKLLHTHHFGVCSNTPIQNFKQVLTKTCLSFIAFKEQHLAAHCSSVWWQRNPLNECILFGRFNTGKNEWVPVVLAYYHDHVGWITTNRDVIEFRLTSHPNQMA